MALSFLWLVHKNLELFKFFLLKNLFGGVFETWKMKDTSEKIIIINEPEIQRLKQIKLI